MKASIDVALILWNPDVIQLMCYALFCRNVVSKGVEPSEGAERIAEWIVSCDPTVVVFDLDPPYSRSAAVVLHLIHRFPNRSFVMTCADRVLALKSAPWLCTYPLFQKPYETDQVAESVLSSMSRASSTCA